MLVSDLLDRALRADPAGPLLTYYDDATGERIELSATTLANWVAKTANFLVDGLGYDDPAAVTVLLPPHWQSAGVLLGVWTAGHVIRAALPDPEPVPDPDIDDPGDVGARDGQPDTPDVLFCVEADAVPYSDLRCDVVALTLDPFGRGLHHGPRRIIDYAAEIGTYGDRFEPAVPLDPDAPALLAGRLELTQDGLAGAADGLAERLGLRAGNRILIPADFAAEAGPLSWLLAPLAAGASVVLVAHPELDRLGAKAEGEKVSATLGFELPGLPVLGT